jgi:hypothetical protein
MMKAKKKKKKMKFKKKMKIYNINLIENTIDFFLFFLI